MLAIIKFVFNQKTIFSFQAKIIFLILLLFSCSKKYYENDLYGSWKGRYENKEMVFTFNNDRNFKLSIKDLITESNEIIDGIYKLNFTKKPMPLSLSNIKQLNHPLHTIVEFMGDDSIRLGDFSPSWRVRNISFEQNRNFVLKRLKQFE